jgi:hypothetical protein
MRDLTYSDKESWFETIWDALYTGIDFAAEHRKDNTSAPYTEKQWDDICTAMAWLAEAAGCPEETEA